MKDMKTLIKIADVIYHALVKLRRERYLESLNQLADISGRFKELALESRKLGLALTHNWYLAAQQCCSRAGRVLDDVAYSVSKVKAIVREPHKEIPELSLLVEELKQLQQEFGEIDF